MIDFETIRRAPVSTEPFNFFMAKGVLKPDDLSAIRGDFPAISHPGIFPLESLEYGRKFADLIEDIRSRDLEQALEQKFDVQLANLPLMITVRGHCQKKDGRIHTDSTDKVVTCLLYLNEPWSEGGGRLRLLHNGTDLEDMITEIPPDGGTFVAFKRSENSWHGHHPFEGPRRYVMFNWVRSEAALLKNLGRHSISARLKRLNPFA